MSDRQTTEPTSEVLSPEISRGSSAAADRGSLVGGIGLLALLHLFQIPLILVAGLVWIGLSQLVYVVPAAVILSRRGRSDTLRGLWIGAGITFLLNGACFGLFLWQMSAASFH